MAIESQAAIPPGAEAVSVSWVRDALNGAGFDTADRLIAVDREPVGAGFGMFGQLARLRLT